MKNKFEYNRWYNFSEVTPNDFNLGQVKCLVVDKDDVNFPYFNNWVSRFNYCDDEIWSWYEEDGNIIAWMVPKYE